MVKWTALLATSAWLLISVCGYAQTHHTMTWPSLGDIKSYSLHQSLE